jgi:hypothetical protein
MAQPTKVITGKVRLSYVHLFEPYASIPDADPKYSVVILVPKSDTKTIKAIQAAQQAALENGKASSTAASPRTGRTPSVMVMKRAIWRRTRSTPGTTS